MEVVEVSVSGDQVRMLRKLVEDALREQVEALRLGDVQRARVGVDESDPKRIDVFFQEALVLIGSDLASLYRTIVVAEEQVEAPVEAPVEPLEEALGEPTEGAVEQEY